MEAEGLTQGGRAGGTDGAAAGEDEGGETGGPLSCGEEEMGPGALRWDSTCWRPGRVHVPQPAGVHEEPGKVTADS